MAVSFVLGLEVDFHFVWDPWAFGGGPYVFHSEGAREKAGPTESLRLRL